MSYRTRLKPCFYTSPSGIAFELQYDDLTRNGGKKSSIKEILDSDESTAQDQGAVARRYPIDVYFVGDDYDISADDFFEALSEKYSQDNPGVLQHPRWGTINVMPIKWTQSEKFVNGEGRAIFNVEFVHVYPSAAFITDNQALSNIVSGTNELIADAQNAAFQLDFAAVQQAVQAALDNSIGIIGDAMESIVQFQDDILDTMTAIESSITQSLDDVFGNANLIIAQAQLIMSLPAKLVDSISNKIATYTDSTGTASGGTTTPGTTSGVSTTGTTVGNGVSGGTTPQINVNSPLNRINVYGGMINNLILANDNKTDINNIVKRNKAIIMQYLAGFGCSQQAVSAVYTEFNSRDQILVAIDKIQETYQAFLTALDAAKVEGDTITNFSGDHNFLSILDIMQKRINSILLKKSYSLSVEKRIILKESTTPIELCYDYYKSVNNSTLEYFINTNNLKGNEIILIPAGYEIVIYGN